MKVLDFFRQNINGNVIDAFINEWDTDNMDDVYVQSFVEKEIIGDD